MSTTQTLFDYLHSRQINAVLTEILGKNEILFPENIVLSVRLRLGELGYTVGDSVGLPGGFHFTRIINHFNSKK